MKYMGSKRWMLNNGLGVLLEKECKASRRFVDLFAGSGAVAGFVASRVAIEVVASDLQCFSAVLTRALVGRIKAVDVDSIWSEWLPAAEDELVRCRIPVVGKGRKQDVEELRAWCAARRAWPITRAYGGHYYSPTQAMWIDALRKVVPTREPDRSVALAALIYAASRCAASPGHTAQPFQPTRRGKRFLLGAWKRDVCDYTFRALFEIAPRFGKKIGRARIGEAIRTAKSAKSGDLVFVDPPYSGVQYSRFYHVLETIANGSVDRVSGVGRYPDEKKRPNSKFSLKTASRKAMRDLLKTIADREARAIVTYPADECSNGLSGAEIKRCAREFFSIRTKVVESRFSTLGGIPVKHGAKGRGARQVRKEMILVLSAKKSKSRSTSRN